MEELFTNISDTVRRQTDFWIDMAMRADTLVEALNIIKQYLNTLDTQENKDYVMFAFTTKIESVKHVNYNDELRTF